MIFIPRVERKIEINAPVKRVFDILDNIGDSAKWNLSADEMSERPEGKFDVKSPVGDFILSRTETIKNEKLSLGIEGGIFSAMGYLLSQKGEITEAILWGEFDDEKNEKILVKAGEVLLECVKNFAEFLEDGGDPEEFDKKQITIAP